MDKIPENAESLTVLVGGVKFLTNPVVAFVRLAQVHVYTVCIHTYMYAYTIHEQSLTELEIVTQN